jgi:hypothetical protein
LNRLNSPPARLGRAYEGDTLFVTRRVTQPMFLLPAAGAAPTEGHFGGRAESSEDLRSGTRQQDVASWRSAAIAFGKCTRERAMENPLPNLF